LHVYVMGSRGRTFGLYSAYKICVWTVHTSMYVPSTVINNLIAPYLNSKDKCMYLSNNTCYNSYLLNEGMNLITLDQAESRGDNSPSILSPSYTLA
jgi:hypothetical protein